MKILPAIQMLMLASLLAVGATALAQSGMGKYQQLYAAGSATTVSGTVVAVDLVVPPGVKTQAVYLNLKTDSGLLPVQLGPEWFVQKLPTRIGKGDKIEVSGARITLEGKLLILAAQVKKGDQVLIFRNSTGVPVWSGK